MIGAENRVRLFSLHMGQDFLRGVLTECLETQ
jgi:hypothetical protein